MTGDEEDAISQQLALAQQAMRDQTDSEVLARITQARQARARLENLLQRADEVVDTDSLTSSVFKSIRNMRRWGYSDEKMAVRLAYEMKLDQINAAANILEMCVQDIPVSRFPGFDVKSWLQARADKLRRGE